jgi:hypothetical protein
MDHCPVWHHRQTLHREAYFHGAFREHALVQPHRLQMDFLSKISRSPIRTDVL